MRVGFGAGVSIPSQLRYVGYVDRWTNELQKEYVERPVEILEVHIWGLRDGVKVAVQGYANEGKRIKSVHMFHRRERTVIESGNTSPSKDGHQQQHAKSVIPPSTTWSPTASQSDISNSTPSASAADLTHRSTTSFRTLSAVIFRPYKPVIVPGSDVNIDFERRSKASYTGFAMVTSVAHVWFNAYFEGGHEHDSGIFETEWDAMDGIKGSAKKGIRAFERLKVVWRYPTTSPRASKESNLGTDGASLGRPISEPKPGEPVHESHPADWRGQKTQQHEQGDESGITTDQEQENQPPVKDRETSKADHASETNATSTKSGIIPSIVGSIHAVEKQLGLRPQTDASKDVSLAGSDDETQATTDDEGQARKAKGNEDMEGVRPYFGKSGNEEREDSA